MSDINKLREVSDQVLHELTADESLKQRILEKAADSSKASPVRTFRPLTVFCYIMVLLLAAAVALNRLQPVDPAADVEINVFAAGNKETVPPEELTEETDRILAGIDPEEVVTVKFSESDTITDPELCASLIRILIDDATPAEEPETDYGEKLIIRTERGSEIVFETAAPYLVGDRCWICQSFFSLLQEITDE